GRTLAMTTWSFGTSILRLRWWERGGRGGVGGLVDVVLGLELGEGAVRGVLLRLVRRRAALARGVNGQGRVGGGRGLTLPVFAHGDRCGARHAGDAREVLERGLADLLHAAEVAQEEALAALADARDLRERRAQREALALAAVEGHGEAVRLVAQVL